MILAFTYLVFNSSLLISEHCPKPLQDPIGKAFYSLLQPLREAYPSSCPFLLPTPTTSCDPMLQLLQAQSLTSEFVDMLLLLPGTFYSVPLPSAFFWIISPICPSGQVVLPYDPILLGSLPSSQGISIVDCLSVCPLDRKTIVCSVHSCALPIPTYIAGTQ